MPSDLASILQAMQCELARINNEFVRIRSLLEPKRCSQADHEQLGKLLPAIAGRFGSGAVGVKAILADPAIRALYPGSLGSLGSLLARAADDGAEACGYCVQRGGKEHGAVQWGVYRLPRPIEDRAGK